MRSERQHCASCKIRVIYQQMNKGLSLLLRMVLIPVVAFIHFGIKVVDMALSVGPGRPPPPLPPLFRLYMVSVPLAVAWVALSIPIQFVTRRLVQRRLPIAVAAHVLMFVGFVILHSALTVGLRLSLGIANPEIPFSFQTRQQTFGFLALNVLIYAVLVAGTLAWDTWQLSVRRERSAAQLAAQLTRAELAALRSRMQPHFLFNALHGISSVMDTDVARARTMMAALSHLLRSSLSPGGDDATLEQELQLTREYLDLQHMRFEERLRYDLDVDVDPQTRVPSFIMQPLVENAVVHGMGDRSEPVFVRVAVRQAADTVEIEVSDNGQGFPQEVLDGTKPLGIGLGALRARILALPNGGGTLTLRNCEDGGAHVIVRVPNRTDGSHA
jgi:two-component system, LytTR family, sensor kinase